MNRRRIVRGAHVALSDVVWPSPFSRVINRSEAMILIQLSAEIPIVFEISAEHILIPAIYVLLLCETKQTTK